MEILSSLRKQSLLRIITIITISIVAGFIYNQLHPRGLNWRYLFNFIMSEQKLNQLQFTVISADSAFVLMNRENMVFIDTRPAEDYHIDHIKQSVNIPLNDLLTGQYINDLLTKNTTIILYDENGDVSKLSFSISFFRDTRYREIYILYGGYFSWLQKSFPIE